MGHDKLSIKESDLLRYERVSQREDKKRKSLEADALRNIDKIARIQDAEEIDDTVECSNVFDDSKHVGTVIYRVCLLMCIISQFCNIFNDSSH